MSEENKYNVTDLLQAAVNAKPGDFESTFNDLMLPRIQQAINNHKVEVAKTMFWSPEEETEQEYEEQETDNEENSDEETEDDEQTT